MLENEKTVKQLYTKIKKLDDYNEMYANKKWEMSLKYGFLKLRLSGFITRMVKRRTSYTEDQIKHLYKIVLEQNHVPKLK